MADGSKVNFIGNRKAVLSFYCNENEFENQITLVVPDDGVIIYTYRPSGQGCITYRLEVYFISI